MTDSVPLTGIDSPVYVFSATLVGCNSEDGKRDAPADSGPIDTAAPMLTSMVKGKFTQNYGGVDDSFLTVNGGGSAESTGYPWDTSGKGAGSVVVDNHLVRFEGPLLGFPAAFDRHTGAM